MTTKQQETIRVMGLIGVLVLVLVGILLFSGNNQGAQPETETVYLTVNGDFVTIWENTNAHPRENLSVSVQETQGPTDLELFLYTREPGTEAWSSDQSGEHILAAGESAIDFELPENCEYKLEAKVHKGNDGYVTFAVGARSVA